MRFEEKTILVTGAACVVGAWFAVLTVIVRWVS